MDHVASMSMSRFAQEDPAKGLPPPKDIPRETLDALFPIPVSVPSAPIGAIFPGPSDESSKTLAELLKDNHQKYHIFFNDRGFHNHTSHHLYAIYALGAAPSLLKAAYEVNVEYQRGMQEAPEEITDKNWIDHLDDRKFYRGYMIFFSKSVLKNGVAAALEKYVFATEANYVEGRSDNEQPKLLDRFLSGLLHPMIHAGHGVEFGAGGMIAEGLAMACITEAQSGGLVPRDIFFPTKSSPLAALTAKLSLSSAPTESTSIHVFDILGKMIKDPELAPKKTYTLEDELDIRAFDDTINNHSELIWKYASEWTIDTKDPKFVEAKVEELSWLVTMVYGVAGLQPGKQFHANFFTMHLVTSALFIPSYMTYLSVPLQVTLLRTYFAHVLAMWVSRGRPAVSISNFYKATSANVTLPGPLPTPAPGTLDQFNLTPNPWYPILQSTIMHPNEHFPKLQRSLADFAEKYGARPAGYFEDQKELDGAELLDGTLFIRVAGLSGSILGWVREGQELGDWSLQG